MYQKYHELKAKLIKVRSELEKSLGPLPDDLNVDSLGDKNNSSKLRENGSSNSLKYNSDSDTEFSTLMGKRKYNNILILRVV